MQKDDERHPGAKNVEVALIVDVPGLLREVVGQTQAVGMVLQH
jgi:hypothetical protein